MSAGSSNRTQRSAPVLHREVLTYGAQLWPALREDWRRLAHRSEVGSAFTSVPWVETWLELFGDEFRPIGVRWRTDDQAVVACALLPVQTVRLGVFSVRRMYLNASGTAAAFCEHNDVLANPAHRSAVVEDFVRFVLAGPTQELALAGVREAAAAEIQALWPCPVWNGFLSESPYVNLDRIRQTDGQYLNCISRNTRSQVRRSLRLYAERFGEATLERARSREESLQWFDEMVELHEARWQRRGESGAFSDAARSFHRRLIERCHDGPADELRATLLRARCGATTIGVLYLLEFCGRANFYQSGLRADDDDRLKSGLVTHVLAVEHYLRAGFAEYDFLGGEPQAARYKQSLATDRRLLAWQELPAPTVWMRLMGWLRRARRRVVSR